jgi:CRP-like cAMP-binding protein
VVAEQARCLVLDPKTFEAMIRGNAEIAVRMIKKLAVRLEEADAQIENLLLRDVNSRVVHHLLHASGTQGRQTEGGVKVELPVATMANALGLRNTQLDEVLDKLVKADLIMLEADGVLIPDVRKLRDFLGFLEMKEKFGDL